MRLVDIDDIRVMMFPSEEDDPSESDGEREYRNGWNDALTAINDIQPSAEPVRMKGKWIIHETENDRYDDMICPFCKTCYTVDACRIDDIGFTAEDFNFCPNCGALNVGRRRG